MIEAHRRIVGFLTENILLMPQDVAIAVLSKDASTGQVDVSIRGKMDTPNTIHGLEELLNLYRNEYRP